jgi:GNAT superfamily N-acetyltransferase
VLYSVPMNLFWKSFLEYTANQSTAGSIRTLDGIEAAWVNSALIINNGTYLTAPVPDEEELKRRFSAAVRDAEPYNLPWALYLYEPYAQGIDAETVGAACGLAHLMQIRVMTGDVQELKPPVRPLPDLEFRRVSSREDGWTVFDINLRSYGMPVFMADSVLDTKAYFNNPARAFDFLALARGVPVSTASVIELDGWLYVALVATDPDHRQKGYAEAVMRHALEVAASELKISRTALDASAMGAPLYAQMGYQFTGAAWSMYAPH